MESDPLFVFLHDDEGVFGIAYETSYGYDVICYLDGVGFVKQCPADEVSVLGTIVDLNPDLTDFFDI